MASTWTIINTKCILCLSEINIWAFCAYLPFCIFEKPVKKAVTLFKRSLQSVERLPQTAYNVNTILIYEDTQFSHKALTLYIGTYKDYFDM